MSSPAATLACAKRAARASGRAAAGAREAMVGAAWRLWASLVIRRVVAVVGMPGRVRPESLSSAATGVRRGRGRSFCTFATAFGAPNASAGVPGAREM